MFVVESVLDSLPHDNVTVQIEANQYHFFRATRNQTTTTPTLFLTLERLLNKKRNVEQGLASFYILLSKSGDYPAISDYEAGAAFGHRFSATDLTSFEFEAPANSNTVVYAIYNDGDSPISVSVNAEIRMDPGKSKSSILTKVDQSNESYSEHWPS